jgi:hypothetical protein
MLVWSVSSVTGGVFSDDRQGWFVTSLGRDGIVFTIA